MKRDIEKLKSDKFDILVIGAGINGCAITRDAALRAGKVALIEKDDFASGASGKTTKLIHGGIRYLEQFNFKLVYEALHERSVLLKTVPHLIRSLKFIIPVYKDDPRSLLKIKAGVFVYSRLAGSDNIGPYSWLKKDAVILLERNILSHNLKGGVSYYDAQMDDVRLCLANAISAYEAGACIANKVEAVGFIKDKNRISAVEVWDKLAGERFSIRASIVVNATGAWSNRIVKLDEPCAAAITRPTKGIHILYRKITHKQAILLSAHKDKRVFFVIPWQDSTLIGTTDTDYTGPVDEVYANAQEVNYLLDEVRRVFPDENIDKKGIITTFASLRPLVNPVRNTEAFRGKSKISNGVNTGRKLPWQVSREHLIRESNSGLISVVGGKYTTYRRLAEQVVDVALSKLKHNNFKKCITAIIGPASSGEKETDLRQKIERAVKEEMANALNDLLVRRLQLSTTPLFGLDHIEECAEIMAGLLDWTAAQKEAEIFKYKEELRKNKDF